MKEFLLLNSLPMEVEIKIIKLEKTIKKNTNTQWSIKFNKTCLKENCKYEFWLYFCFLMYNSI